MENPRFAMRWASSDALEPSLPTADEGGLEYSSIESLLFAHVKPEPALLFYLKTRKVMTDDAIIGENQILGRSKRSGCVD